jgi:hypothetical protein
LAADLLFQGVTPQVGKKVHLPATVAAGIADIIVMSSQPPSNGFDGNNGWLEKKKEVSRALLKIWLNRPIPMDETMWHAKGPCRKGLRSCHWQAARG